MTAEQLTTLNEASQLAWRDLMGATRLLTVTERLEWVRQLRTYTPDDLRVVGDVEAAGILRLACLAACETVLRLKQCDAEATP